ncbi:hypothetical protein BDV11DRAFT_216131 [Aspergillus similis]
MPFSLPYYRNASQLPGPLPDLNEIERAARTLPKRSDYGRRLVLIRDKYVVKYGLLVTKNKGYALIFVKEQLNIAAPLLHTMYHKQDTLCIIMEYIPGISLGTVQPSLTKANKNLILSFYLACYLLSALRNYLPIFTHGDLYREKVLVKKVVNPVTNKEEYKVAAFVDWEMAGWYPSYWEYAHIFPLLQWIDD